MAQEAKILEIKILQNGAFLRETTLILLFPQFFT
jgi:hypothetical protein